MNSAPMRQTNLLVLLGLALLAACARNVGPERDDGSALAGLRLPIIPGSHALVVNGQVGDVPARVVLEVAAPMSLVSHGCFLKPPRGTGASVRIPQPRGGLLTAREVVVEGVRLGERRVPPFKAGVREGASGCEVVLGSDVLLPYALEVDPAERTVLLARSRPADALLESPAAPGEELHVIPLTREPTTDLLLLTARLTQGDSRLTGPFILSTGQEDSSLASDAAATEGFEADGASQRIALDTLELAPDFALERVQPRVDAEWSNPGALGLLGADVWSRFRTTLDVKAGMLVLRRPAFPGAAPGAPGHVPDLDEPEPEPEPEDPAPSPPGSKAPSPPGRGTG
ncbi:MAG: hypothetical protein L0Y66_22880 [Myxococcaceae bacterium]|nr:hypothetical protein [Myxococcaceae bacterium]MCI0672126.1 hypothetical protein [Myxococcaceae bacterium]